MIHLEHKQVVEKLAHQFVVNFYLDKKSFLQNAESGIFWALRISSDQQ